MALAEREIAARQPTLWRCTKEQYYRMAEMGWFLKTRVELIHGLVIEKFPDTPSGEPRPLPWTRAQYQAMADLGWFAETRVERLAGEIIHMPPMGHPHRTSLHLTAEVLARAFGDGFSVITQSPFTLGLEHDPEPDVAVVAGSLRDYADAPLTTAALVVEISASTLAYDRTRKTAVYAQAGIAEYWIVNLEAMHLEVHRQPDFLPSVMFGYKEITVYSELESIAPLAAPQSPVAVADLLP